MARFAPAPRDLSLGVPSALATLVVALLIALPAGAQTSTAPPSASPPPARPAVPRAERKPQPRPSGQRVAVDPSQVEVDDGDTAVIHWTAADAETVRYLGIDTPETRHVPHDLPYAQPFGPEARAFGMGAFAVASKIELVRSAALDPYRRTLGYFFLDGKSYGVLVIRARLAEETISHYGDNGLPAESAEIVAAAKAAGPLPFESPAEFRKRMREVSRWMKEHGVSPEQ
jgi:endonuclease YncB( thermonuclease family)